MLDLAKVFAVGFKAPLELLSIFERALLLILVDLFQKGNALNATLFGVVAKMSKTISDTNGDLNNLIKRVHFALKNLCKHFINVVRVSTIYSDLKGFQVVTSLKIKRNLLDDLLFVEDQEIAHLLLVVLSKLGQLGKIDTQLDLIQNIASTNYARLIRVKFFAQIESLGFLLFQAGLLHDRERMTLINS